MSILEALWGGGVRPCDRTVKQGSEYDIVRKEASKAYDHFWDMLTPEEKDAYNTFSEYNNHLLSISEADIFTKGFRLGIQLIFAAICKDDTQLPMMDDV